MTPWPSLQGDEVHVWKAALDGSDSESRALSETLSSGERTRAAKFHLKRDQERFARCRGILRLILGRYLETDPSAVRFDYNANGKPALSGPKTGDVLSFNVSHSDATALIAVCLRAAVGVDLERLRPVPDAAAMVESYFSAAEKSRFESLPPEKKEEAFLRLWTLKEAYLKARGEGLSRPLDEDPAEGWSVRELAPGPGFAAALAKEGEIGRISLFDWKWKPA